MANKILNISVTPGSGVKAYWIAIGNDDVRVINNKGSIEVQSGKELFLIWWFIGNPGGDLTIEGKVSGKTVAEVKKSLIPKGKHEGAGAKRFKVN